MPHALIYVEVVWVITQSELPTDSVAMGPPLVADGKPDWTTTRAETTCGRPLPDGFCLPTRRPRLCPT